MQSLHLCFLHIVLRDSFINILFLAARAYATSLLQSRSFDRPGQMALKQNISSASQKGILSN